jgi:MFS family permease
MKYLIKVFLEHFSFGLTIPFSIVWMLQQGMTLPQVGLIQTVIFVCTFLLELPTGAIADTFGRKNSLTLGALAHTLGLVIFLFSHSFLGFFLSALCTGAAWALISGAEETYLHDIITPQSGQGYKKLFSRVTMSDEVATLLGMFVGSILTASFSLQSTFVVAAFFMFLTVIYLYLFLPTDSSEFELEEVIKQSPYNLRTFFQKYHLFLPTFVALAILYESARILWQPALLEQGVNVSQLGFIFAALKIFSLFGSFIAEKIELPHKTAITLSGIIAGIALLGLSTTNLWLGIIGLAIYFMMENIFRINQSAFLLEIAPNKNEKTTFISSANLIRNVFSAGVSPVLGLGAANSIRLVLLGLLGLKMASSLLLQSRKDTL